MLGVQGMPAEDVMAVVRWRTCAIIGSAGLLLQRQMGRWIDSHDATFRFNSAHTLGVQRYVGSHTALRLVNRENFGWRELEEEATLQHCTTETLLKEYAMVSATVL
eukprot:9478345-Pyramimonas_sp.AAC.2